MKPKNPLRLQSTPNPDGSTSDAELQEMMLQDMFLTSPKEALAQLIRDLRATALDAPEKAEAKRVCVIARNVWKTRFPGETVQIVQNSLNKSRKKNSKPKKEKQK